MLTHASVDFRFDYVFPSQVFVNDIDSNNEALASLLDECWQKCSGVLICSGKSIFVILKQTKTRIGILCSSLSENIQELNGQLLIFSKISLFVKYIQSSPFCEYMGTEFGVDILCNTVNFFYADQKRFVRHMQKCKPKIQEDLFTLAFNSCLSIGTCN